MSDSIETLFVSSKALRRASITNNKEDATLEKKKTLLRREFRAQELKLETAKKRLTRRKHSYDEERNKSIVDIPRQQTQTETARDGWVMQPARKTSSSALPSLQETPRKTSRGESLSLLTIANLRSHNEINNCKTRPQIDSVFPPVGCRSVSSWNHPTRDSESNLCSKSVSGKTSVSVYSAPARQIYTTAKTTREQEQLLNMNQSAEKSLETRTGQNSMKFSSINLRARLKFVTHMTGVLRRSCEAYKYSVDNSESGCRSNDTSDLQRECEGLENYRYLRKPLRKEPMDEHHDLAGEIKTKLVVKGL